MRFCPNRPVRLPYLAPIFVCFNPLVFNTMNRFVWLALLPTLAAPAALAQASRTFERNLPLDLYLDHSTFAYDGQNQLVDIYVGVDGTRLPFRAAQDGGFEALVPLILALHPMDAAGVAAEAPVWRDAAQQRFTLPDTSETARQRMFVQVTRAAVPAGRYELRATVPAPDGGSPTLSLRQPVDVSAAAEPGIADVTLASSIRRSDDRADPFFRNGLSVQPHPSLVFGNVLPMVQYYTEVYGTTALADTAYTLRTRVVPDGSTEAVDNLTREQRRAVRPTDVVIGSANVRRLPSGAYTLNLDVLDGSGQVRATSARRFHVYNPGVASSNTPVVVAYEASSFASMLEADVQRYYETLGVIGSEQDRIRMREITDLAAKRRYLYDFWAVRDANPATPDNEGLQEFERRLALAETRYGRGPMVGYRTDRGRVLIKYGEPQEIQRSPMSRNNELRTFEVWGYEGLPGIGQAQFVFIDRRDTGNLEQVYSNVPGERSVTSWRCELSRLGQCDALGDLGLGF